MSGSRWPTSFASDTVGRERGRVFVSRSGTHRAGLNTAGAPILTPVGDPFLTPLA
jgi:hypothetical protein